MSEGSHGSIAAAIGWATTILMVYTSGGGYMPFLLALRSIRIQSRGRGVRLTGMDAGAMLWSGFVLWALPPLLLVWGLGPALLGGVGSLVIWLGFRLSVHVTPTRTRLIRKVAFCIPWSWRVYRELPRAYVDGWGDFADPEGITLGFGDGHPRIELAWGDKTSGTRCDDLAAELNAAVAALRR